MYNFDNESQLIDFLNEKVIKYNTKDFIPTDPIQIPHLFTKKEDIEISALLLATIAWGNRTSIINNGNKLMEIMQNKPHEFIINYDEELAKDLKFVHRTFNAQDLDFFFRSLNNIYLNKGGLEKVFEKHPTVFGANGRIVNFRKHFFETEHDSRSEKHVSNPLKNSAAKRLNMFLRWMTREDQNSVDFGIWKSISMSELNIPLDVHTANSARKLGLITRKQNDGKTLVEIMIQLRKFDSKDPSKYDFALFGIGAFE
jgi:uncharacterized protein (TIGR02757 family)